MVGRFPSTTMYASYILSNDWKHSFTTTTVGSYEKVVKNFPHWTPNGISVKQFGEKYENDHDIVFSRVGEKRGEINYFRNNFMEHDSWKKKSYFTLLYIQTKCDLRNVSSLTDSTISDVHFALSGPSLLTLLHSGIEMIFAKKTNAPRGICSVKLEKEFNEAYSKSEF